MLTLTVQKRDGSTGIGTAFLILKDGIAVTAWHVIREAARVTANTQDKEEFEVSGLIDKDEKRDVALIRVKIFGRPLLSLASEDPAVGSGAYVIGAPRALEFSISDGLISQIQSIDGGRYYQFTCAVSPGNSGGPLLDAEGGVLGVVSWQVREGQNLNFAIPARYVLGLDASLPTRPWEEVKAFAQPVSALNDNAIDKLLADAVVLGAEIAALEQWVSEQVFKRPGAFKHGVPPVLYTSQRDLARIREGLSSASAVDSLREAVRRTNLEEIALREERTGFIIQAIREAQASAGWTARANDYVARARSVATYRRDTAETRRRDLKQLYDASASFRGQLPRDLVYVAGISDTATAFKFGVPLYPRDPLFLIFVPKSSWAYKLGFRSGDRVVSAAAETFSRASSLEDLKAVIVTNLGKRCVITVERDSERIELTPKLPREIPADARPGY